MQTSTGLKIPAIEFETTVLKAIMATMKAVSINYTGNNEETAVYLQIVLKSTELRQKIEDIKNDIAQLDGFVYDFNKISISGI